MHGTKASEDGVKTYGFLVAITATRVPTAELIAQAIDFYMDDDNHYKDWVGAEIDVEPLGEIDCYEEEDEA